MSECVVNDTAPTCRSHVGDMWEHVGVRPSRAAMSEWYRKEYDIRSCFGVRRENDKMLKNGNSKVVIMGVPDFRLAF